MIEIFVEKNTDDYLLKKHYYITEQNILRLLPEFVYNYFLRINICEINIDCFIDNPVYQLMTI